MDSELNNQPNVLLVVTDGMRADAMSIAGHPVLQTPYLDELAAEGTRFQRAYSSCPVCIPARRSIMSGANAATHGILMNHNAPLTLPTLAESFAQAGYHTHMSGKLHLHPPRRRYGFHSMDLCDRPTNKRTGLISDDYQRFLLESGIHVPNAGVMEGGHQNGWVARPFALPDQYHLTNWTIDRALRFLERRDPTAPFFLNVSIFAPHGPCAPPDYYFQKYMSLDLPEPVVGDWARVFDAPQTGLPVNAWRTCLPPRAMKEFMAGYLGCIEHLDHQLGRLLQLIPEDTIVIFVSDHGEMLGDHQWIRKRAAFEGSARVPFLLKAPERFGLPTATIRNELVDLIDVMPTLLDLCGIGVPETIDGRSLVPLLRNEDRAWREVIHGECCRLETLNSGMQFLTDARWKYIYYPGTGDEQLFDLSSDPRELQELANHEPTVVARFRAKLADTLKDRPEGFVENGRLKPLGRPSQENIMQVH